MNKNSVSIQELFPKCRKLAYDARQLLAQCQNGILETSTLFLSLENLNTQLHIMNSLVQKETPSQREIWKCKINEVQECSDSIWKQAEFLNRERFSATSSSSAYHQNNGISSNSSSYGNNRDELFLRRRRKNVSSSVGIEQEQLTEESGSLQNSHNMMRDVIGSAESSYVSLTQQNKRLRGINSTLVEIGNVLGITQTTMKIIERRDKSDAYLVLGGCILTMIVIYVCYFI